MVRIQTPPAYSFCIRSRDRKDLNAMLEELFFPFGHSPKVSNNAEWRRVIQFRQYTVDVMRYM